MNFFNKAYAQFADIARSMSPRARLAAVALFLIAVVSLAYLANRQVAGSHVYLFGGDAVAGSQWPAMVEAFSRANLTDYELDGSRVRVPTGRQAVYLAALADAGALPMSFGGSLRRMLENSSPFVSPKKQEELIRVAMQEELSKIISSMRGIEWATVMYDVRTTGGLNSKRVASASVTVKPLGEQSLTREQVLMIRNVVAYPISTVPENVAVVDLSGRAYPTASAADADAGGQESYVTTKLMYEERYTEQIRDMLSFVAGAVVTVNVELHPEIEEPDNQTKVDPSIATAAQHAERAPEGALNIPAAIGTALFGQRSPQEPAKAREPKLVGYGSRQVRKAGLTPKRVTVSVGIPNGYFVDVWRQRNPSSAGSVSNPEPAVLAAIESEVRASIQKHVLQIIPLAADPSQLVTITTFPSLPVQAVVQPDETDRAIAWLTQHGGIIGLGFLGFVSLLVLRSIVRSVAKTATARNWEPAHAQLNPPHGLDYPTLSLHDELAGMVREDPDAAANILRNWIASAN